MTQRLHSAGIADWECLHVASPCGLGLVRARWPQCSSSFYTVAQESKSEYSREQGRLHMAFSGLASLLYSVC